MARSDKQSFRFGRFLSKVSFKDLAIFSGNLATCLEAGLSVPDGLETCTRSSPSLLLRSAGLGAAERARSGMALSEALGEISDRLPRFFLPVLHCGERSGRTDEALRYLEKHCALLEQPSRTMRNMWLVPLVVFSVSSVITIVAYFAFSPLLVAARYFFDTVVSYATLAAIVVLVLNVPQLRRLWEQLLMALPVVGQASRELAVNRFLHAFNLMYCSGGIAVARMVGAACSAVDNSVVRDDLLGAIPSLDRGATLTDSLAGCSWLTADEKGTIAAGEEVGKIEDALKTLCRQTSESLQFRLVQFQAVFFRLMIALVAFSTVMTVFALLNAPGR